MSSVGQAIGGIVGGVIGFFVGGPTGALYGAQLGMMAGGIIDPPDGPVINGPRLDDLTVQTSTYGAFIPRNYGTVAQHGNIFWLKGDKLTETPRVEESGGKGGPTTTTNLWDYSATFALGLCDCSDGTPIDGIRRIWINGQLFYDGGSDDISTIIASNEQSGLFTLYTGTDTQKPDPLMQADKGAANVPAYRGLAYIVFDNLPLAKYNNSLAGAQIKVEIVKNGSIVGALVDTGTIATQTGWHTTYAAAGNPHDDYGFSNYIVSALNYPWQPYWVKKAGNATSVKLLYDGEGAAGAVVNSLNNLQYAFTRDSNRYVYYGRAGQYSFYDAGASFTIGSIADGNEFVYAIKRQSGPSTFSLVSLPFPSASSGAVTPRAEIATLSPLLEKLVCTWNGDAIVVSSTGTTAYEVLIERYREDDSADLYLVDNFAVPLPTAYTQIGTAESSVAVSGNDLVIVFRVNSTEAKFISIDLVTKTLNLERTITGSLISVTSPAAAGVRVFGGAIYWGQRSTAAGYSFLHATWILKKIASSTVPLSTIVSAECLQSNLLAAADLDVTELTDLVRGYRVSSLGALRGGIDPVRAAWPFDVVQNGYKIKFKRRGSASVVTINADELDARAAGENPGVQITNSREMDTLLPSSLRLKYIDAVREYDTNEQVSDRGL